MEQDDRVELRKLRRKRVLVGGRKGGMRQYPLERCQSGVIALLAPAPSRTFSISLNEGWNEVS